MTTTRQFVGLHTQMNEIIKRVGNGSLDPVAVKRALQVIIESKPPAVAWSPPAWWRTPEQQLKLAHALWPDVVLPEPPARFVPQTATEVLLLHVPDTFSSLWDKVVDLEGREKYRWDGLDGLEIGDGVLQLVPQRRAFTAPVWVAFDPEHGKGMSADSLWDRGHLLQQLATSEVLSALIQFPDWQLAWFADGTSAPTLPGCWMANDKGWLSCLYIGRFKTGSIGLRLETRWSNMTDARYASPTVREC